MPTRSNRAKLANVGADQGTSKSGDGRILPVAAANLQARAFPLPQRFWVTIRTPGAATQEEPLARAFSSQLEDQPGILNARNMAQSVSSETPIELASDSERDSE